MLDHKESTERQYHLAQRAIEMGWKPDQVDIIDQDQGVSSDGIAERKGFSQLTSMVGLGQVGIVFIPGEQVTAGAPWKIRITGKLLERFHEQAPEGYVSMLDAMRILGVSRQTVLNRVKRGELDSVHVRRGRRKGLLIRVFDRQTELFD